MNRRLSLVLATLLISSLLSSSAEGASARENYRTYCTQCHGTAGTGGGINTDSMSVQPRDHTDAKGMGALDDAGLKKAISEGGLSVAKSVLMPPWRSTLTEAEIDDLVSYLRELCKC